MVKPGLVSVTFRDKPADEVLEIAAKCGLMGIEWGENAHVMPGDPEGAAELRRKTQGKGLAVAGYGSYFRLCTAEKPAEAFRPSLESAQALGAPYIRVWAGTLPSAEADEAYRNRAAEEARVICTMAEEAGIKIALEWHKNTLTDTNESAFRFLEETAHDNLYCLWQPTVALSLEERQEGLGRLGDRLLNIHTYYWPEGKRAPFEGGFREWRYYLEKLPAGDRYMLLEFVKDNTPEQLAEDAEALKRFIKEINP